MKSILAAMLLAGTIVSASAQTMPNANQTPEQSNAGTAMPNANRTPEGSNALPSANGTLPPPSELSPNGTVPQPSACVPGTTTTCPACPAPPVPPPAGSPQTLPSPQCSPVP